MTFVWTMNYEVYILKSQSILKQYEDFYYAYFDDEF